MSLNTDEQAIIDKARNMAAETTGLGGDADGPPSGPATPSTPTGGGDDTQVWGPYSDGEYHLITPPWGGQFGVPVGHELHFEERERLVKGEIRTIRVPVLRDAVAIAKAEAEILAETKAKMVDKKKAKASA